MYGELNITDFADDVVVTEKSGVKAKKKMSELNESKSLKSNDKK